MLNFIYRVCTQRSMSIITTAAPQSGGGVCFIQLNLFSSAATITNLGSFAVNYLTKSCVSSPKKGVYYANRLGIESTEKQDSVIAFLRKQSFTAEQINILMRKMPAIFASDPQKTLLPKIEFFRSLGGFDSEVTKMFMAEPRIFHMSLENHIVPAYDHIKCLFDLKGKTLRSLKCLGRLICCNFQSGFFSNVEALRGVGVPDEKVMFLLHDQPRDFMANKERFKKAVREAVEMGFNPLSSRFVFAVNTLLSMSKLTWEKKLKIYKRWGLSEGEIISVFLNYPRFMKVSTKKVMAVMDFLVDTMGFDSSIVLKSPNLLFCSLGRRVRPRCRVYKILIDRGLVKERPSLNTIMTLKEKGFLELMERNEKQVPGLLKLYHNEVGQFKC